MGITASSALKGGLRFLILLMMVAVFAMTAAGLGTKEWLVPKNDKMKMHLKQNFDKESLGLFEPSCPSRWSMEQCKKNWENFVPSTDMLIVLGINIAAIHVLIPAAICVVLSMCACGSEICQSATVLGLTLVIAVGQLTSISLFLAKYDSKMGEQKADDIKIGYSFYLVMGAVIVDFVMLLLTGVVMVFACMGGGAQPVPPPMEPAMVQQQMPPQGMVVQQPPPVAVAQQPMVAVQQPQIVAVAPPPPPQVVAVPPPPPPPLVMEVPPPMVPVAAPMPPPPMPPQCY